MQQVCKVDMVYYCDYVQQHGSNFGAVHFLFGARNFRNSLSIFIFNEVLVTKAIKIQLPQPLSFKPSSQVEQGK